jgi:hypothetical protein
MPVIRALSDLLLQHRKSMNPRKIGQLKVGVCWNAKRLVSQRMGSIAKRHRLSTQYA